ncbi:MAG: DUF3179 domain-containing protein [Bacteroidota bacterium]
MRLSYVFVTMITLLFLGACRPDPPGPTNSSGNNPWLIPDNEVRDGGPGKDGIPSVDDPVFTMIESSSKLLDDNELVVGFKYGNITRAYPHTILDWHEIVNDKIDDLSFSVIYCPLTGSATIWNREYDGKTGSFGVSGLLYNTNIIPYDRKTDSNWSQMRLQCVNGERMGDHPETFNVVETTWQNWRKMYPSSEVMTTNTGFNRDYGRYPYGGYRTNTQLIFPVSNLDDRLHAKERALAVIVDGTARGYPISALGESELDDQITVIQEEVNGLPIVVAGSAGRNLGVAFQRQLADGTLLEFEAVNSGDNIVLRDQEGNEWDVFGYAINGVRQGQQLQRVESFIAYWFAWGTFYDDLSLYEE